MHLETLAMGKPSRTGWLIVLIAFVDPAPIVARAQDRKESAQAANPVAEEIQEAIIALRNTDIVNSKGWATAAPGSLRSENLPFPH